MEADRPSSEKRAQGWEDLSALLPDTDGWMHSGMAVDENGVLYCAHPNGRALLRINLATGVSRAAQTEFSELHGIALTRSKDIVAIADPGYRVDRVEGEHAYEELFVEGHAAFIDVVDGFTVQAFSQPDLPQYSSETWRPTSIAVDRDAGRPGDVWIADGYGASLVHRFSPGGELLATVDGSASGRVFDCPHAVALREDPGGDVEVLVADRANHRIVVLDSEGRYLREFGEAVLDSPSGFALMNGELFISELHGGVARFDENDVFIGMLEPERVRSHDEPSWPNRPTPLGGIEAPNLIPGIYNSPHGIAAFEGEVYVNEWLVGGRLSRTSVVDYMSMIEHTK